MADELNLVASVMELILKILPAILDSGDAEYRWKGNRSRESGEKEPIHLPLFICYFSFSFLIYTTKQTLSRMLASDSICIVGNSSPQPSYAIGRAVPTGPLHG